MTLSKWQSGRPILEGWYHLKAAPGDPFEGGFRIWGYWNGYGWLKEYGLPIKFDPNKVPKKVGGFIQLMDNDKWRGLIDG